MSVSKEIQERINLLFEGKPEMIEKLYKCDVEALEKSEVFHKEELILMIL